MTRDELIALLHVELFQKQPYATYSAMGVDDLTASREKAAKLADAIIAKCTRTAALGGGTNHVLVIEGDALHYTASKVVRRNEQAKFKKWADRLYEIACGMRKEAEDA